MLLWLPALVVVVGALVLACCLLWSNWQAAEQRARSWELRADSRTSTGRRHYGGRAC